MQRASNSSGTLADEGTYNKCTLSYTWSAIGSNARTTAVDYKETTAGTWTSGSTALIASGGYVVLGSGTTFAIDKSYDIRFTLDDSISSPVYAYVLLPTAKYIMDFKVGGTGLCFGGAATRDNSVEVSSNWECYYKNQTLDNRFGSTRDNWSTNAAPITHVVGQLAWKNYSNGHTIFDASNSTTPSGTVCNNANAEIAWSGTFPTLMGWNGYNTYGVRVDSARVADTLASIANVVYPVGSIYMSTSATNPGAIFGGTWVRWGQGRVPVSVSEGEGEFAGPEYTGGEKYHTLSAAETPSVTGTIGMHAGATQTTIASVSGAFSSGQTAPKYFAQSTGTSGATSVGVINFNNGGSGWGHNNMQPYIACYMWKRTA